MRWAVLSVMVASCTFPDVSYDDASTSDASLADTGTNDEPAVESGTDTGTNGDAGEAGNPCDEDNDTYLAKGSCGGNDCDDHDPRVNPGAGFLTDIPTAYPYGDWNCDGTVDSQYPIVGCGIGIACDNSQGFLATVACGKSGAFVNCSGLCSKTDAGMRTQGCR